MTPEELLETLELNARSQITNVSPKECAQWAEVVREMAVRIEDLEGQLDHDDYYWNGKVREDPRPGLKPKRKRAKR